MIRSNFKSIVLVLGIAIAFQSCVNDEEKAAKLLEEAPEVQVDVKEFAFKNPENGTDAALQSEYNVRYELVNEVMPKAVKDSIDGYIAAFIAASEKPVYPIPDIKVLADSFFNERAGVAAEFGSEVPWSMDKDISVKAKLGNLLTMSFFEASFMGGAHPNSYTIFKVFDLSNGKTIQLADIIAPDKMNDLNKLRYSILEKERKTADLGNEWKSYFFEDSFKPDGAFYTNENFKISTEGLYFFYNSYEIAAYAFGTTEISIPMSELKPLLNPESPYFKYFK